MSHGTRIDAASSGVMTQRLMLLLQTLTDCSFRPPPKGVGLKTLIEARDAGLITYRADGPNWVAKLTEAGKALQASAKPER